MYFRAGQHVAQVDHALLRVLGVFGSRKARDQFAEVGESLPDVGDVALGKVGLHEAASRAAVAGQGGEALHVVGVIHVGMLRDADG